MSSWNARPSWVSLDVRERTMNRRSRRFSFHVISGLLSPIVAYALVFPLYAEVIEQEMGTLHIRDSVPDNFVYLLLITRIESMPQTEALALVEDRIGMSATDGTRFVEFAVSEAQRIERERMAARLDMLCTPADSETTYQRLQALQDLAENKAEESMILSRSFISREAAIALQRYLDDRKLSTAYVRTDYRKTFEKLRIDVRNHVDEECAA